MARRRIRVLGEPVLHRRADEVTDFDASLRRLVEDMVETMYVENGVGLAAPQVGVGLRVITFVDLDEASETHGEADWLVNPELTVVDATPEIVEEGCLSVPGIYAEVPRARRVVVRGADLDGAPLERDASLILARCLQHEVDHLDGVLFLDRLDDEARARVLESWRERNEGADPVVKRSPH